MTPERRYRLLFVSSHPVQYASPLFREMACHPQLEIEVAYCSLQGAEGGVDPEFGREVKWDVPLLDGYSWTQVPNLSLRAGLGRFFGLFNPGLWRMVRKGRYDAVFIYTGYQCSSFWIALVAAKLAGTAIIFGTDAVSLIPPDGSVWKARIKERLWPRYFRLADQVVAPSTGTRELLRSLGIDEARVTLTPYVVDNAWWKAAAAAVDRGQVRAGWRVPPEAMVVLFAAKLQPWKRPLDLLKAFAEANLLNTYLVYVGDGPLAGELQSEAAALGVANRVRFLGFVNQSQLPAAYRASDLFVLPSAYDAFGVVVNEAMLCGCAVAVSDRVGAGRDLVSPESGFVFPCGDVKAIADVLRFAAVDGDRLRQMGESARKRMETWSPRENIEGQVAAVERAIALRGGSNSA